MLWWCKCPFFLMCPSRMWLALFRLCQCLSTSGPDRRSTWCPIRVVLLAMCAVKIPLHYSFVTQCVEVFFLSVKFRHNSVCVGVRWHGLKKWNKTSSYFMYLFSSVSAVWIEWEVSGGFLRSFRTPLHRHHATCSKSKTLLLFLDLLVSSVTKKQPI